MTSRLVELHIFHSELVRISDVYDKIPSNGSDLSQIHFYVRTEKDELTIKPRYYQTTCRIIAQSLEAIFSGRFRVERPTTRTSTGSPRGPIK